MAMFKKLNDKGNNPPDRNSDIDEYDDLPPVEIERRDGLPIVDEVMGKCGDHSEPDMKDKPKGMATAVSVTKIADSSGTDKQKVMDLVKAILSLVG